ncbi:MAG TPA: formylglycine-generating enzyme family protein [Sideroxyarcus sp.]|nr:formylglycine-generating enzyme family protein [Sideroxyarcus sp.]
MRNLSILIIAGLSLPWLPAQAQSGAGKAFRDCPACPEMVVVPAGRFNMGSPPAEAEGRDDAGPVHRVKVARFALGKTEITKRQFATFVKQSGYRTGNRCETLENRKFDSRTADWRNPGYAQNDRHPVTCVNWDDAKAYAQWLSRKTGKPYRLPSEAEWEYAARANSRTENYWGNDPDKGCKYANGADQTLQAAIQCPQSWSLHGCRDGFAFTAPVASFRPNSFGLYDMLGNVWEWTEDSYHDSYEGAPTDGSAWQDGSTKRVIRGGSWYDAPRFVRAAGRDKSAPESRYANFGFRVARKLP